MPPPMPLDEERPGIMPETEPPMLVAVSLTWSTTRLITLRAGALRATTAAPAAAAPAAAPTAARRTIFFVFRFRADALPALRAAAERFAEDAPRFLELFFELFLLDLRLDDERLLDERFFDDRFFEDFFEDFEDLRDERFLEAAIWFLLLTVLDSGAESERVAGKMRCRGNSVARNTI